MPPHLATPNELYSNWPDRDAVNDLSHERIRLAVAKLKELALSPRYGSFRKLASETSVSPSTITDVVAGRSWPSALTISRIEVRTGVPLWPVLGSGEKAARS